MATHSSILAWRIPRTAEPGGATGYSSWGCKESDPTEPTNTFFRRSAGLVCLPSTQPRIPSWNERAEEDREGFPNQIWYVCACSLVRVHVLICVLVTLRVCVCVHTCTCLCLCCAWCMSENVYGVLASV